MIPSVWVQCLAVAETLGTLMALSIGLTLTLPDADDLEFRPGLVVLVVGLTLTIVGAWRLPNFAARQTEPSKNAS
ncbi:hypothetical protein ACWZHB_26135 [Nocardia sp. FBN12]|uniref:hypothetical protein n=1 Tax=Nocardia sp. FBN12 TaxID=3419766 RepID=UPI003D080C10